MCNQTTWLGVYFPNGFWLKNSDGSRIVFDNKEAADTTLSRWNKEGKWLDGVVKEFIPPPPGCVLYS